MTVAASAAGRDDAPATTSKDDEKISIAAEQLAEDRGDELFGRSVTINRPRPELYAFWRDFANLSHVMENVERVEVIDDRHSRWVVAGPAGQSVEWVSEITEERPDELIAWRSLEGADVDNAGRITFADAPGGRGTVVSATIVYDPPAGGVGRLIAKLFQREPAIQARRDMRRFKQLMETGEISTAARNRRIRDDEDKE